MGTSFFEVGARYRNRREAYEVMAIRRGQLEVRLDDGTTAIYDAAMQERIVRNMASEQARIIPDAVPAGRDRDFAWTLGALAATARLEAEVPPKAWAGFVNTYSGYTGDSLSPDTPAVYLLDGDENKWGAELRLYFPELLGEATRFVLPQGTSVVSGFSAGESRINRNAFWWHLVERCGFRVGSTQPVGRIRDQIGEDLGPDFDAGFSEWGV